MHCSAGRALQTHPSLRSAAKPGGRVLQGYGDRTFFTRSDLASTTAPETFSCDTLLCKLRWQSLILSTLKCDKGEDVLLALNFAQYIREIIDNMTSRRFSLLPTLPVSPQRGPLYGSHSAESGPSTIEISSVSESVFIAQRLYWTLELTLVVKLDSK